MNRRVGTTARYGLVWIAAAVFAVPVYLLVNIALRDATDTSPPFSLTTHPTFASFSEVWSQANLAPAMLNSVVITTISCVSIVIAATMASYPLARSISKFSSFTFFAFLAGLLVPLQLAIIPLYFTMRDLHLLGTVWGMIIYYTGLSMPFAVFLCTTFLRYSVPLEFEEAARIDGCGDAAVFWRIVFPLMRPVVGTLVILSGVGVWNDFLAPTLYLSGSGHQTVPVALSQFVGRYTTNWSLILAGVAISVTPVLILYMACQRYVIQGFSGGVKG